MASQAGGLIQDQNINVHFDVAPLGVKSNVSKVQKPGGGLGGRKALNDISNSGRPSSLQTSKKHNSKNVVSLGEDVGPFKLKSFGGNTNISKAPEKVQVSGGRKALSDLTNSRMPHLHKASKKNHDKKLSAVVEDQILSQVAVEEKCLHNHQECIKAQRRAVDMRYFLETIGLANDDSMLLASPLVSPPSRKLELETSPTRYSEMEEMPELLFEDRSQWKKTEMPREQTPCGNPKSPKSFMHWRNYPEFKLMETPKFLKHWSF